MDQFAVRCSGCQLKLVHLSKYNYLFRMLSQQVMLLPSKRSCALSASCDDTEIDGNQLSTRQRPPQPESQCLLCRAARSSNLPHVSGPRVLHGSLGQYSPRFSHGYVKSNVRCLHESSETMKLPGNLPCARRDRRGAAVASRSKYLGKAEVGHGLST